MSLPQVISTKWLLRSQLLHHHFCASVPNPIQLTRDQVKCCCHFQFVQSWPRKPPERPLPSFPTRTKCHFSSGPTSPSGREQVVFLNVLLHLHPEPSSRVSPSLRSSDPSVGLFCSSGGCRFAYFSCQFLSVSHNRYRLLPFVSASVLTKCRRSRRTARARPRHFWVVMAPTTGRHRRRNM